MSTPEKMTTEQRYKYCRIVKKRNRRARKNKGAGSRRAGLSMDFKLTCEAGK